MAIVELLPLHPLMVTDKAGATKQSPPLRGDTGHVLPEWKVLELQSQRGFLRVSWGWVGKRG
jgi:hypothetical protein